MQALLTYFTLLRLLPPRLIFWREISNTMESQFLFADNTATKKKLLLDLSFSLEPHSVPTEEQIK